MSLYSRKVYNVDNGEVSEPETDSKMVMPRTSLVVQWLRLCVSTVGSLGSIPGQGIGPICDSEDQRSHELQLRPGTAILTYRHYHV